MTKRIVAAMTVATLYAACGGGQEPTGQDVEKEVKATMERIRTGEKITETDSGLNPCTILESGVLTDVFGVEAAVITYRPGSTTHPLCLASWRKPNADELEAGQSERMMDWMKRKLAAQSKGEPFDEKMPIARPEAEVSLTLYSESFDSAAAAAQRLEGMVATMSEGRTVTVQGKEYTSQVDYEDWTEGVGDRAAWAPKLSQLSVAAEGHIFHVAVRLGDAAENRAKAIELARKIAAAL